VWTGAIEVVGIPGAEYMAFAVDDQLQLAANHHATLLTRVMERDLSGVCARCIVLVEDLNASAFDAVTHLPERDLALSDLEQLL
jgi:hypothetical protein